MRRFVKIKSMQDFIKTHWVNLAIYLIFFVWLIIIVSRQNELRYLVEWGDESETIVVTKMMASGQRLDRKSVV